MALKVKKIVGGLLALLLALVLILICVFFFWLGPTVKMVAQQVGSKALGAPLTITKLTINPRHGTLHMTGFAVANHNDFGRTNALSLGSMDIALDVGSIFSPTVVVHRVQIESPHFVYEQNEATDNITRFIKSIKEFTGPADMNEQTLEEDETGKKPKAVVVEQLEINDIQFHLANTDAVHLDLDIGIEQLTASMTNGMVRLNNLHVSNPELLETPNLFTLDEIEIEVDPASIYSETVSIRDARITRPYAYLERNPQTDTAAAFLKIAGRFAEAETDMSSSGRDDTSADIEVPPAAKAPPPIKLHRLLVDDIQVKLLDSTATNATAQSRTLAGVGSISVKLVDGRIRIQGIRIPNPAGYRTENLFHLSLIDIVIEPESLFSGRIQVEKVLFDSPELHLEQTETSSNLADLQTALMGFVPPAGVAEGAPTPEAVPQAGERPEPIPLSEQPVVLHELIVTNFLVTLKLPHMTNTPASFGGNLANLNPMERISLEKMNPLSKRKEMPSTNTAAQTDLPLDLVFVDRMNVQPLAGKLTVNGLGVANMPRFDSPHLVTIEQLSIQFDPDSLQSGVLVISEILIDAPRVAYERKVTTDNIQDLQETMEQAAARRNKYEHKEPELKDAPEPDSGTKVIINHLLVQNGRIKAKLSALPTASIPLPDIELKDLGKAEGGATIGQALSKIGGTFYDSILGAISGTTGFAVDALKGAGALTLGTLGKATGINTETDGQQAEEEDTAASQQTGSDEEGTSPTRKRRSPFMRRHPGRFF